MLFLCLFAAAGIAGCAPTNLPASGSPVTAAQPAAISAGRILSMRVVSTQTTPSSWRALFLADAGATGAASDGGNGALVEFIVRTDDGSTLSVVQANEREFHTGDRVIILHDGNARLVRPS